MFKSLVWFIVSFQQTNSLKAKFLLPASLQVFRTTSLIRELHLALAEEFFGDQSHKLLRTLPRTGLNGKHLLRTVFYSSKWAKFRNLWKNIVARRNQFQLMEAFLEIVVQKLFINWIIEPSMSSWLQGWHLMQNVDPSLTTAKPTTIPLHDVSIFSKSTSWPHNM